MAAPQRSTDEQRQHRSSSGSARVTGPAPDRFGDDSDRLERRRLRERVEALERELAASERRRQEIVRQYERVLEERDRERTWERDDDGLLARLLNRLR